MENKRILVVGGSGYIGQEIVLQLIKLNYNVTVMSRNVKTNPQVKTIRGNVLNKPLLESIIGGYDLIIYLAAIIRTIKKDLYLNNIKGLNNLIAAMKKTNRNKIIYFSTQNVLLDNPGPYGKSKKLCEDIILSSGLEYIILRPNYVYGIDKNNDFYKLIYLIKKFSVCPIIGDGKTIIEPINKVDVAKFMIDIMVNYYPRKIINFSGPKPISINTIINIIQNQLNLKFYRIYVPLKLLKLIKNIIPFDLDGFNQSRIAIAPYHGRHIHNIEDDLLRIDSLI